MTNQAAQTMQETCSWIAADDVYRHARTIDVALNGEAGAASRPALCDVVSQIATLARQHGPLAAALSQTAGVPDGMVMVQKHDLEWIVAHVLDECDGSGPCADLAARRVRAMLAAAPAASGGEDVRDSEVFRAFDEITGLCRHLREGGPDPDDLQELSDGLSQAIHIAGNMLAKLTDPTPQPPAAASVSERARELLAQVYDQAGDSHDAAYIRNGGNGTRTNGDVHIRMALRALSRVLAAEDSASPTQESDLLAVIAEAIRNAERHPRQQYGLNLSTLRALEQALTQQRGDDVESAARALFEAQADRLAAPWDRQWEPTKEQWRKVARGNLYATTPQPSADAVRELVAKWRDRADAHEQNALHACSIGLKESADSMDEKAKALRGLADELESLLSAASGEKGVG